MTIDEYLPLHQSIDSCWLASDVDTYMSCDIIHYRHILTKISVSSKEAQSHDRATKKTVRRCKAPVHLRSMFGLALGLIITVQHAEFPVNRC